SPSCSRVGTLIVSIDIVLAGRRLLIAASSQIPDTRRSAVLGVAASGGHRKGIPAAIGAFLAGTGDRHLAFEDEQACVESMRVLRIDRAGLHPAVDDLPIA